MSKIFILLLVVCAAATVFATDDEHTLLTSSSTNQAYPYRLLTRSQAAVVPAPSNFRLTNVQPALVSQNAAQYKITLSFERGCADAVDRSTGQSGFPVLRCVYTNAGFQGCTEDGQTVADGFFVPGQEVYFASSVELKIQLTRGNRADVSLPVTAVIVDEMYCDGLNAQETVLDIIAHKWLARDYYGIIPYLDYNVVFSSNVFAYDYHGIASVIGYFALGDPSISDSFEQLNTSKTSISSRGNLVTGSYHNRIKSLQLPEGSNIYEDDQLQMVFFTKYNQVIEHRVYVNTALVFAMFPQANHPSIEHICTIADTYCVGPLQQYADHADCVNFLSSRPVLKAGPNAQPVGTDDLGCRGFHSSLAVTYPQGHCLHLGPYDARLTYGPQGLFVTPCVDDYPVPGQAPLRQLPSAPTARSVERSASVRDLRACASDMCKYSITRKENLGGVVVGTIAFDQLMTETLIPAAGAIVQEYVNNH